MSDALLGTFTPTKLPTFARTPKWWSAGVPAAIAGQVRCYLQHYQRQLKARPTDMQRRLMQDAAIAAARYDKALRDYTISGSTLAHYERVSRKATAAMLASFPKRQPEPELTLDAFLDKYGDDNDA